MVLPWPIHTFIHAVLSASARSMHSDSSFSAFIHVQDMDQQLVVARMRIVQLTAEVQSSKQAAHQLEEKTAALQAQVLLRPTCFSGCHLLLVLSSMVSWQADLKSMFNLFPGNTSL